MNPRASKLTALAAALTLLSCKDQPAPTESRTDLALSGSLASLEGGRHVVLFTAERVPSDFAERISSRGGAIEAALDSIGVATVTGLSESAAAELAAQPDVRNVEPDPISALGDDAEAAEAFQELASEPLAADATASPTSATFYARQWNMRAVFADQAWASGHLGSRDVVVAILDTGIDYLNPDLVGLVDLAHSTSFVPGDIAPARYAGRLPISDFFWHGTAVTSIVASNATILAGVNRHVTLLAVKIADSTFRTSAGRFLSGIVYAADQGADVINLSNNVQVDKSQNPGTVAAFERAVNYAFRKGALLVATPGNDSVDLDHNGDRVRLPCEAANAICVSATGPTGATSINGPWVDVDAPGGYSAFGRSAISFAAPGGTGAPGQFRRVWVLCTTTPTATTAAPACRSGPVPRLAQGLGSSFAAPHVAGLAALLAAQLGHRNPALIRARILQSADDLGQPGTDPYYGKGRINVARALGLIQ